MVLTKISSLRRRKTKILHNLPKILQTVTPRGNEPILPGTKGIVSKTGTCLLTDPSKLRYKTFVTNDIANVITDGNLLIGKNVLAQCFSWSLPARITCPDALATEFGHICFHCLADGKSAKITVTGKAGKRGGNYARQSVIDAQMARLFWTLRLIKTPEGREEWIETMVRSIKWATRVIKKFRIHDSGDFFNARYVAMWQEVIRRCPEVMFWASTRTHWRFGAEGTVLGESVRCLRKMPNVVVRFSSLSIDVNVPDNDPLQGTTVITHSDHKFLRRNGGLVHHCPAHSQGNVCGSCNVCFVHDIPVAFEYH